VRITHGNTKEMGKIWSFELSIRWYEAGLYFIFQFYKWGYYLHIGGDI